MKAENLANEDELQSYFVKRIEKFLNSKGRRLIGWGEILQGGLAPHATVMSWRGTAAGIEAAKAGHDVVMAPTSHLYFDYAQSKDRKSDPKAGGKRFITLEKVYDFEPIPRGSTAAEAAHILARRPRCGPPLALARPISIGWFIRALPRWRKQSGRRLKPAITPTFSTASQFMNGV